MDASHRIGFWLVRIGLRWHGTGPGGAQRGDVAQIRKLLAAGAMMALLEKAGAPP